MLKLDYGSVASYLFKNRYGGNSYHYEDKIIGHENDFWKQEAKWCVMIPKNGTVSLTFKLNCQVLFGHMYICHFPKQLHSQIVAFVRNPYDRLVSAYEFMIRGGFNQNPEYLAIENEYKDFEDWVWRGLNAKLLKIPLYQIAPSWKEAFLPQHYWLMDRNKTELLISPENIGRFENFKDDAKRLLNIEMNHHLNKSERKELKEYYFNPKIAEKVYKLYEKDFILFGYSKELP